MVIALKSGCDGFNTKLSSLGMITLGTRSTAERPLCARRPEQLSVGRGRNLAPVGRKFVHPGPQALVKLHPKENQIRHVSAGVEVRQQLQAGE